MMKIMRGVVFVFCLFTVMSLYIRPVVASAPISSYDVSVTKKIGTLEKNRVALFPVPVLFGVVPSKIVADFGDVRGGGARVHEGQDIVAPAGTPIVSPTKAVVVDFGYEAMPGNFVTTVNPGGETFHYLHLDTIATLKIGDVLTVGDYIGTVGDTGNAKGVGSHLHFEVHHASATNPLPRMQKEFSLKEKMQFVSKIVTNATNSKAVAQFLVEAYPQDFNAAYDKKYVLPKEIQTLLTPTKGSVGNALLVKKLETIIASIPSVVKPGLAMGSKNSQVSLLQLFLIHQNTGPHGAFLARSGVTGYFGGVTKTALMEYQANHKLEKTGVYDAQTQKVMLAV